MLVKMPLEVDRHGTFSQFRSWGLFLLALPKKGKDIVFRFTIEYSS
jgi:hypothetical protein